MEDIHLPTLAWLWDEDWHIEMDFKAGFQFSFSKCFDLASATHCSVRSFSGHFRRQPDFFAKAIINIGLANWSSFSRLIKKAQLKKHTGYDISSFF
jgi:hypothetical protein